jgi:hypothetical protein
VAIGIAAFVALLLAPAAEATVTYTTEPAMPTGGPGPYGASDVSVDQSTGEIYAANKGYGEESSISRLSPTGTLLNSWQETPGNFIVGDAFDSSTGTLYSLDGALSEFPYVYKITPYNENGTALSRSGFPISAPVFFPNPFPYSLDVDSKGQIYFPDRHATVTRFDSTTGQPNLTIDCSDCPGASSFLAADSVATDSTGAIYVADGRYDVDEEQKIALSGGPTGGTFKLTFNGQTTGATGTGDVRTVGATGTGDLTENLNSVTNVNTSTGTFAVGQTITGSGIPAGTRIESVSPGELNLSQSATETASGVSLQTDSVSVTNLNTSTGAFVAGEAIAGSGIPAGTTITGVAPGELRLSQATTADATGVALSADLGFDASDTAVGNALKALPSVGSSGVEVSQEGSLPGAVTYTVTFRGTLAGTDVPQITASGTGLTGGSPSFAVSTPRSGVAGGEERVVKFHPDGSFDSVLTEFPQTSAKPGFLRGLAVAVDPATDDVFVGSGEGAAFHIVGFDALGNEFADFGTGAIDAFGGFISEYNQMAVSSKTGVVYVSDRSGSGAVLRVFAPVSSLSADTERALEVGPSTATVTGVVNPNGEATTSCKFEYGPTNAYGKSAPCETSPGSASIRTPVSVGLSELNENATYHYRVVESTGAGTVSGADKTFSTPLPGVPTATTGAASGIAQAVATLNGTVNPQGGKTTCVFEYGKTTSYGASLPCSTQPGSGSSPVAVSVALSGLVPATTYHYRLKATNAGGPGSGKDATLTTLADTCQTKASLCPPPPPPPVTTPTSTPAPILTPTPTPKPLKCKKGFKKVTKHGKARCVKSKAHKHKKH